MSNNNIMKLLKKITTLIIISTVIMASTISCSYNKDLLLAKPCDTTNLVSYSFSVAPVLQNNCVSCHNNTDRTGNITFEQYSDVKQVALSGKLIGVINHESGFFAMPLNRNKLEPCIIDAIRRWVNNGALDN